MQTSNKEQNQKARPFLQSKRTAFRPIEKTDIQTIARWLNDPMVTFTMFYGQTPMNEGQIERLITAQIEASDEVVFMVEDRESSKPIGLAGLHEIHTTARKAATRHLIGEVEFWNKGFGTEVLALLLYYGFDRLNLHRIFAGMTGENQAVIKNCKAVGFCEEGVRRDDIYRNGRYYDSYLVGILRDQYYPGLALEHKERYGIVTDWKAPLK